MQTRLASTRCIDLYAKKDQVDCVIFIMSGSSLNLITVLCCAVP
jgi:hypothetical protein